MINEEKSQRNEIYLYQIPPGIQLDGTEDNDVLIGSTGSDTISGFGGNDVLEGLVDLKYKINRISN
ncbi:MAG: hypothetical protein AB4368_32960 [Xenococcaceae cyanobacterium]